MTDRWHRTLLPIVVRGYYRRVDVVGPMPPARGPLLLVGLHRNGAVDGMVYKTVVRRATFLVAARLLRGPLARLFFAGIPVARARDAATDAAADAARAGGRPDNAAALRAAGDLLAGGGALFVFPEGTSDLGPRHLPFHRGAAVIAAEALRRGVPLTVVPAGIFYTAPERFRSDVAVVFGAPLRTDGDDGLTPDAATLHRRITAALEALGVNVATAEQLASIEALATLGAEESAARRYRALKALEREAPPAEVAAAWRDVHAALARGGLVGVDGVPLRSRRGPAWNAAWLALQAAAVAAGAVANVVPLAGAYLASRRLADGRNTIALWRLLVGAPLCAAWAAAWLVLGAVAGVAWPLGWALATGAGTVAWPELRARWPRLRNALSRDRDALAALTLVQAWTRALAHD